MTHAPGFKTCSRCKMDYPATLLFFRRRHRRGWKKTLTSWCLNCYKQYNKENAVKKRKKEVLAEWRKNNPDKVRAQNCRAYQREKRKKKYSKVEDYS